eukprot:SAG31_NODE_3411_length_4305_cov_2.870185_3_plen_82_part_00
MSDMCVLRRFSNVNVYIVSNLPGQQKRLLVLSRGVTNNVSSCTRVDAFPNLFDQVVFELPPLLLRPGQRHCKAASRTNEKQ